MNLTVIQSCPDLEECAAAIHGVINTALLHNSLKIMEGKSGGGFFAQYVFDNSCGKGYIRLLLQYPDGAVVPVPLCKNLCRLATDDNDGVETVPERYPKEFGRTLGGTIIKGSFVTPMVKGGVENSSYKDYSRFIKYERPDFKIPMDVIWKRIIELWEELPIITTNKAVDIEEIYMSLLTVGLDKAERDKQFADMHGVYLTRAEIEDTVLEFGATFNDIRRVFENRNLWLKDSNTAGYQYTKRVSGKLERFYKLRKVRANEKVQVEEKYCMEYTE